LPTTSELTLPGNRQTKTAVLPSKTSATPNGRSPTNAPQFPKTCPTNLRRNRQNRCLCQPAWPKTSAPTLPGNRQTKPAFAHQNLRRNAKANQPTGLNFAPPCQSSDQAQNDPKLVAEPRQLLLSKTDALPKCSTEIGRLPPKPFAVCQNLEALSPREQPAFWKRTETQTLKNHRSSDPTNATVRCAGAVIQCLCHSPKR
jgi:hypothetical protein